MGVGFVWSDGLAWIGRDSGEGLGDGDSTGGGSEKGEMAPGTDAVGADAVRGDAGDAHPAGNGFGKDWMADDGGVRLVFFRSMSTQNETC